ncbi:MAG: hypothetical protein ACLTCB_01900 [Merdibacter sp.]
MKKHLPYVLIAAAAALDQISKYLIEAFIPLGGTIPIIDGFFSRLRTQYRGCLEPVRRRRAFSCDHGCGAGGARAVLPAYLTAGCAVRCGWR